MLILLPLLATAEPSGYDHDSALAISQAAIGRQVGDHRLTGRDGRPISLAELRGRPVIVSLIYTSCHHICPMLTSELADVVEIAGEALGEQSFTVLTVGFDSAVDTPQRMGWFADARRVDRANWYFAAADDATIAALSADLGFIFFPSPKGFDHLAQTSVLDADGRVYRQIYGDRFDAPRLVEPLKELLQGQRRTLGPLAGWLEGVRLFCTIYDPTTGRYRFDYSLFVTIGVGLICLGGLAVFIVRAWRQGGPPRPAA